MDSTHFSELVFPVLNLQWKAVEEVVTLTLTLTMYTGGQSMDEKVLYSDGVKGVEASS